jgi:hypothetical protein
MTSTIALNETPAAPRSSSPVAGKLSILGYGAGDATNNLAFTTASRRRRTRRVLARLGRLHRRRDRADRAC